MIFISDAQGNILNVLPSTVNQNSNLASRIILIAPFSKTVQVSVAFTLPNGSSTTPSLMGSNGLASAEFGENYGVWTYDTPQVVTALKGRATVQFFIHNGTQKISTTAQSFEIYSGVDYIEPELTDSAYNEILNVLSLLGANVENLSAKNNEIERARVSIGLDYPNFEGEVGVEEGWKLAFPKNTAWVWINSTVNCANEIVLELPNYSTSQLFIYVKVQQNVMEQTVSTAEDFKIVPYYWKTTGNSNDLIDFSRYKFVANVKIPKYNGVSRYPWLNMGGIPYRWKGEIVENIELKESLATINNQKITEGGNIEIQVGSGSVEVDSELSLESENPVQNKVLTEEFNTCIKKTNIGDGLKIENNVLQLLISTGYGLGFNNGVLYLTGAGKDELDAQNGNYPIQARRLAYGVKQSLINPNKSTNLPANWTEEEKALARQTIGASKLYKHTIILEYILNGEGYASYIYFYSTLNTKYTVYYDTVWGVYFTTDGVVSKPYAWDSAGYNARELIITEGTIGSDVKPIYSLSGQDLSDIIQNGELEELSLEDSVVGV